MHSRAGLVRTISLLLALAIVATACGSPDRSDAGDGFTVRDSSGVEIMTSHEPQWDPGEAWVVSPEPVLVIGERDTPDPARQFSRVSSVLRLSDGRIVVLDSEAAELRYFGPDGAHLGTAGGRGRGPGEFNYASAAMRVGGDTVVVEDRPVIKHVIFDPDGEFVREERFDHDRLRSLGSLECGDMTLPDRSKVVCLPEAGQPPRQPDPGPGHLRTRARAVRVAWDISSVDTLGMYGGIEQWGISISDHTRFAAHPFHSRTFMAAGRDPIRIAIAVNPSYSIEIWTPGGELERVVKRSGARRAPTAEEAERAVEALGNYAPGDEALANRFRSEVPAPDSIPAVTALHFSELGELIVGRSPWIGGPPESNEYDVFSREGRWLGTIVLPGGFQIQQVGRDYILGIRPDELEVPYVELYRLTRPE